MSTTTTTTGTADVLRRNGIQATPVRKVAEGSSAEGEGTIADLVVAGEIDMVFNTPSGGEARSDGYELRAAATSIGIPCITTVAEFNAQFHGWMAVPPQAVQRIF